MSEPLSPEELQQIAEQYELPELSAPEEDLQTDEAERRCNRLLEALADVRGHKEANARHHREEVQRADRWLARVDEPLNRQETWILAMLTDLAPYVRLYGRAKSRDLPRGRIGWRTKPERLEVADPTTVLSWAMANGIPVKSEHSVIMAELSRTWKERRQITPNYVPPGCKIVEAQESFYVDLPEGGVS